MRALAKNSAPGTEAEDLRLMGLVAAGNRHAQRLLAHRLATRVLRITRRLLQNGADADDAAQQAIVEILQSAGTYSGEAVIERWADRVTARTAMRYIREQRRRPWELLQLVQEQDLPTSLPPPNNQEETPRHLDEYLSKLARPRREVIVLKHVFGYTVEEIAELTETPLGTVKDRLIAARRQLRKMIQRELAIGAPREGRSDENE